MALTKADKIRLLDPEQTSPEEFLAAMHGVAHEKLVEQLNRFVGHLRSKGIEIPLNSALDQAIREFAQQERPV